MGDEAYEIALEHFVWCRERGFTNDDIIAGLGVYVPLSPSDRPVIELLEAAHRQLLTRPAA